MKNNLCVFIQKVRYPKSKRGRKAYVRDSLDGTPVWIEIIIILILSPVIIGLLFYLAGRWIYEKIFRP